MQHASSLQIRLFTDDTLFYEFKKTFLNTNKTKYMLFHPHRSKVKKAEQFVELNIW